MNPAYKHLETRLAIGGLTIGQWGGVIVGVALAVGWGMYLSPFPAYVSLFTAIYLGGVPVLASFLAAATEFDLWLRLRAAGRYRRGGDRYLPGAGRPTPGYRITPTPAAAPARPDPTVPDLELPALWD